ncbi:MAG: glycerol kinase GlpK [Planctomycetaceae bacterium]|nr:glycerol kinase GlpK [Planctomycetaceae bacterium]
MKNNYILAIDQGTSATKAVVFDTQGRIAAMGTEPLASHYPRPGFVEQDPLEIYRNVLCAVKACLNEFQEKRSPDLSQISVCGISNQRETFCLWDASGTPLGPAIVWQCKRSVDICSRLQNSALEQQIKWRTGLIADPYFSATKLIWLYEQDRRLRAAIEEGDVFFGTIDTWLLYKLTAGQSYCTDYTNACRTLFFNLDHLTWDDYLLEQFQLSGLRLPQVRASSSEFGSSDFAGLLPRPIRIGAMIGDSHAAAFGEGCFAPGTAKATLGTGCSILLNTGGKRVPAANGMMSTICWSTADRVDYALEGIIVSCGSTINWLRDNLGLFKNADECEAIACCVPNNGGVYLVPAFSGLGAPHWNMDARAVIAGLTLGCDKSHVVRAALESIPFQIKDVIAVMEDCSEIPLKRLHADGGISKNSFIMQFMADLLQREIINMGFSEVSAYGAACLAGLQAGIFKGLDQLPKNALDEVRYSAIGRNLQDIQTNYEGWRREIQRLTAPGKTPKILQKPSAFVSTRARANFE